MPVLCEPLPLADRRLLRAAVLQLATTEIPGCAPSSRSMIFPCGLSAPAVVAVNVSPGSCSMMSMCSVSSRV